MRSICFFLTVSAVVMTACSTASIIDNKQKREEHFIIWAHSDIQFRNDEEKKQYEAAVNDVAVNIGHVEAAIVGGDIIQGATGSDPDADFQWFLSARSKAPVTYWYEISGNHDARFQSSYDKNIKKPLHYAVRFGSLLMIFLSDEDGRTSGTEISDDAFNWWKDLVEKNRSSSIMTVTHTNLDGIGFKYALLKYRNIDRSERFLEVLKKEKVDMWLSGHTHSPSKLNVNEILPHNNKYHTLFLNVASIRKDFFFSQVESRFLIFKKGSNLLTIRTRYHDRETFVAFREFTIELSHPFVWNGQAPEFIPYRHP
jgi:Calcineurin-like phosphoesterase